MDFDDLFFGFRKGRKLIRLFFNGKSHFIFLVDADQKLLQILIGRLGGNNAAVDHRLFNFLRLDDIGKALVIKQLIRFLPMLLRKIGKIVQAL